MRDKVVCAGIKVWQREERRLSSLPESCLKGERISNFQESHSLAQSRRTAFLHAHGSSDNRLAWERE